MQGRIVHPVLLGSYDIPKSMKEKIVDICLRHHMSRDFVVHSYEYVREGERPGDNVHNQRLHVAYDFVRLPSGRDDHISIEVLETEGAIEGVWVYH